MTAIPADIQKAAAAVYTQLGRGSIADEQAIAKALMAERERCAVFADKRAAMSTTVSHPAALALLQALPDAIRSPQPSSPAGA